MASDIRDIQVAGNVAYEWGILWGGTEKLQPASTREPSVPRCFVSGSGNPRVWEVHPRDVAPRL